MDIKLDQKQLFRFTMAKRYY